MDEGSVAYYFLVAVSGQNDTYRMVNSQGRVVLGAGALSSSAEVGEEIHQVVTSWTEGDLRRAIGRGESGFRSGALKPQTGPKQGGTP